MPMPDTQNVELRTDTIEQLVDLLQYDKPDEASKEKSLMSMERRWAVAERLRNVLPSTNAIILCGLPGAGKSYTAKKLSIVYDVPVVSMGDAIRHEYKQRNWRGKVSGKVPDSIPSDKLGEFASEWRDKAPEQIPQKTFEIADDLDSELVIIDGLRSMTDYNVLRQNFNDHHLIEVKTPFYERLNRISERGREGESSFGSTQLAQRDQREMYELGFNEVKKNDVIDLEIMNSNPDSPFPILLSNIVENDRPYEIEDGRPLGLDDELEEKRRNLKAT